ncbi:MAG: AbiV family abortive infection protein [Pseudomonadota bacterium]
MLALDAIEDNSRRLYIEALGALDAEHYATAVALSIFSFEEAAKYVILKRQAKRPELPKKRVFRHEVKHEEIGELFWYWAIFSVLTKTFEDFKSFTSALPDPDPKVVEMIQGLSGGNAVDFLRYNMFASEDEMRAHVRTHFPHPELLDVATAGATGKIEAIRRQALYVDPSPDLNLVLSSPSSIGNSEANEWLKIAFFGQEYIKLAKRLWNEI